MAAYECHECGKLVPEGGHHVCRPPRDPYVRAKYAKEPGVMARLVDYGFADLNRCFDALPFRARLGVICKSFDDWVAKGGKRTCMRCDSAADGISLPCAECATKEPL